jgi:hypothetical protein
VALIRHPLAFDLRLSYGSALLSAFFRGWTVEYIAGAVGLVSAWYHHDYKIGLAALFACLLLLSVKRLTEKVNDLVSVSRTQQPDGD